MESRSEVEESVAGTGEAYVGRSERRDEASRSEM